MKVDSVGTKLVDSEMPSVNVFYEQEIEKKTKQIHKWLDQGSMVSY